MIASKLLPHHIGRFHQKIVFHLPFCEQYTILIPLSLLYFQQNESK